MSEIKGGDFGANWSEAPSAQESLKAIIKIHKESSHTDEDIAEALKLFSTTQLVEISEEFAGRRKRSALDVITEGIEPGLIMLSVLGSLCTAVNEEIHRRCGIRMKRAWDEIRIP